MQSKESRCPRVLGLRKLYISELSMSSTSHHSRQQRAMSCGLARIGFIGSRFPLSRLACSARAYLRIRQRWVPMDVQVEGIVWVPQ